MRGPLNSLIERYKPETVHEFENALKEIIQEITLSGLARANFFDRAAFYGGTALRIFYGLPRFSEDLDFTLLSPQPRFSLKPYFHSVSEMLRAFGIEAEIEEVKEKDPTGVESAFLKANTIILLLRLDVKAAERIQSNKKMLVKFEVDTTPPLGFETEVKVLSPPITATVKVLKPSYLFGGKMHAILFRKWKTRVKGRDFYDLLWYLGQKIPLNLEYLENKMRDTGNWSQEPKMTHQDLMTLLTTRIENIDFQNAAQDVMNFVKDPDELAVWSREMFLSAVKSLQTE